MAVCMIHASWAVVVVTVAVVTQQPIVPMTCQVNSQGSSSSVLEDPHPPRQLRRHTAVVMVVACRHVVAAVQDDDTFDHTFDQAEVVGGSR